MKYYLVKEEDSNGYFGAVESEKEIVRNIVESEEEIVRFISQARCKLSYCLKVYPFRNDE